MPVCGNQELENVHVWHMPIRVCFESWCHVCLCNWSRWETCVLRVCARSMCTHCNTLQHTATHNVFWELVSCVFLNNVSRAKKCVLWTLVPETHARVRVVTRAVSSCCDANSQFVLWHELSVRAGDKHDTNSQNTQCVEKHTRHELS